MKLTEEQIQFLDKVCGRQYWTLNSEGEVDVDGDVNMSYMNLTEIPVKFGTVSGRFACYNNNLTTLKNCPTSMNISSGFYCFRNNLTEYFKSIKAEDFPLWCNLDWWWMIKEYPFLINISSPIKSDGSLKYYLNQFPQTKLYLKD